MAELHDWQGVGTAAGDGYEWFYFDAEEPVDPQTPLGAAVFISIMGPNPFDFSPFGMRADGRPGVLCPQCARGALPQNHYGVAVGGFVAVLVGVFVGMAVLVGVSVGGTGVLGVAVGGTGVSGVWVGVAVWVEVVVGS